VKVNNISEKTLKLDNFAENIILNCYVMVAFSKISMMKAQERAKVNGPPLYIQHSCTSLGSRDL